MSLYNSDSVFWNLEPLGIGMKDFVKLDKIHFYAKNTFKIKWYLSKLIVQLRL